MARWEAALDAQLDIYKMATGVQGSRHIEAFGTSVTTAHPAWAGAGSLFHDLPRRIAAMAFNADPIYVDPDMQTLWEAAWPSFQPEPLAPTDLVTPYGCVLLPRPLTMTDLYGKAISTRAIIWCPANLLSKRQRDEDAEPRGGIILALFHGTDDKDDFTEAGEAAFGPYLLQHVMSWGFGDDMTRGNPLNVVTGDPSEPELVRVENVDTTLDLSTFAANGASAGPTEPTEVIRPLQCLWRLMSQTIAVNAKERPSKPFRKRWTKAFPKEAEKRVTVVRLRRSYEDKDPGEPHTVEWKNRWLVGGHWRLQWYPSVQLHRQIWISPYVKGPADKELVINKSRVFELVR